jgi:hypothetical protein
MKMNWIRIDMHEYEYLIQLQIVLNILDIDKYLSYIRCATLNIWNYGYSMVVWIMNIWIPFCLRFTPASLLANGEASKQQRRHGDKHRAEAG